MSSDGPSEEELIAASEQQCVRLAAVYVYDHVLTFGQEVAVLWTRRKGWPTVIYSLLHLLTALELVWYVVAWINIPSCRDIQLNLVTAATYCGLNILWGFISAVRVHAINGREWPLSSVVMALYWVPVIATIYDYSRLEWVFEDGQCHIFNTASTKTLYGIIVADAIVLAVTWRVTYGVKKLSAATTNMKLPLTSLLIRDALHPSILLVLNVINIVMWTSNASSPIILKYHGIPTTYDIVDIILYALTTILLSRLLLNLRQRALTPQSIISSPSQLSDIRFSTLIESLSGSLPHGSDGPDSEGTGESSHYDSLEGERSTESGDEHELGVLGLHGTNSMGQESSEATPVGSSILLVARV
ncbi:uncharacterized protein B0H18DRAFT_1014195 [Fomitopsis serialis]|uniref:uncharacterized protein n=1 Tax=Fomitopsis serialis TaxID=139415 RepID=UPI002008AD8B|nr:uncharacterized protein B0H18DRAFT_1014195 [Neoantrodia serialis]KAH9923606.1 hypothetical protein B0H18DRAFT_1014195 [Neoantrodia serialis]